MENVDVWRNASSNYCNEHNHGHLLAIETENEKNFITGEFLSAGFGRVSLIEITCTFGFPGLVQIYKTF